MTMAYNFSERLDYLGQRMKTVNENSLTYERPGSAPIVITNFTACRPRVLELGLVGQPPLITAKNICFIFDYDLLVALTPHEPQHHDQIHSVVYQQTDFTGVIYEVTLLENSAYDFITSSRKRVKVNCEQIARP